MQSPTIVCVCACVAACGTEPSVIGDAAVIDGSAQPQQCMPVVGEPELELALVAEGLADPVTVAAPPNDSRLFVTEQNVGRLRVIDAGEVLATPFADFSDDLSTGNEQGLLGLAFHPNYGVNQRLFVTYTRRDNGLVLQELQPSVADPNVARSQSRKTLLVVPQTTAIHHSGTIAFGPQGYLFLSLGDSGPQNDPDGNGQNLGILPGKILRINVDDSKGELAYDIPRDNPFVGVAGAREEIWALGLRNPWAWSIDPATGHLFLGDVGLSDREEINVIPASAHGGTNFGWPIMQDDQCREPGCNTEGLTTPVYSWAWGNGFCAAVGGQVYRGCRMPGHHGTYFFSDFCNAFLRSFRWSEFDGRSEVREWTELAAPLSRVSNIGRDSNGELIVVDYKQGKLFRIVPKT